ncbi:MAG: PAS domain S-box protein [Bacteroidales bacterium]|nr:PAS domain S-box protein [Bacteroidales bacterium]
MMIKLIIISSLLLRLATFAVVMNYYKVSRHRKAWLLIAAAMVLLALESLFQLLSLLGVSQLATGSFIPHVAGLAVSILMLSGTALISYIMNRLVNVERTKDNIERRFQLLFNTSSDQVFVLSLDGQIAEVNHSVCERLEMKREDLLTHYFKEIKAGSASEGVMDHIHTIRSKGKHIFETELRSKSGRVFPVEINCRLVEIDDRPFITCVARNISERQELDKKVRIAIIETEEKERKRFAKEIHDGLGPLLSAIKLYVNELEGLEDDSEEKKEFILHINHIINEAVDSARNIANNITPKILTDFGLTKALTNYVETINATNVIQINTHFDPLAHALTPTLELTFYRIATELINNSIKHANASSIDISLSMSQQRLHLEYRDNGDGFDLQQAIDKGDNHLGVKNIISRVRSMNGIFNFRNTSPGIQISIVVDVQPE